MFKRIKRYIDCKFIYRPGGLLPRKEFNEWIKSNTEQTFWKWHFNNKENKDV